jgi:hypothetical protein
MKGATLLADDAYWLFHDDRSGRPRIPARVVGIAMAAAVLAEQTADHLFEISAGRLRPVLPDGTTASTTTSRTQVPSSVRPLDAVAAEVLARVAVESEVHPVRDWLAVLSQDVADLVGRRMVAAGVAVERGVRRDRAPWGNAAKLSGSLRRVVSDARQADWIILSCRRRCPWGVVSG